MRRKVLSHATIVFGGMCFVLFVIDVIKKGGMSFLNNGITKGMVAVLSLLAIGTAVTLLATLPKEEQPAQRPVQRHVSGGRTPSRTNGSASSASHVNASARAYGSSHTSGRSSVPTVRNSARSPYSSASSRTSSAGRTASRYSDLRRR